MDNILKNKKYIKHQVVVKIWENESTCIDEGNEKFYGHSKNWQVFTKSGTHPSKMKTYVDISIWTQILIGFICNCQNLKAI